MINSRCFHRNLALMLFFAILFFPAMSAMADKNKTLRGKLKPTAELTAHKKASDELLDTINAPADSLVRLSGYDKPLHTQYESIFVSNNLPDRLVEITLRIVYIDTQGRSLHELTRTLPVDIPAGETRRLQFRSWDKPQTFYYIGGRRPRTANVTPYDIKCNLIQVITTPNSQP